MTTHEKMLRETTLVFFCLALCAAASGAQETPFPPRNRCQDVPGHVKCLTEHGGLIHGAEITTPAYVLTCRAFRQLWLSRYYGRSSRSEMREVVAAGVCEQRDHEGELIRRWDTLKPLKTSKVDRDLWASTRVSLPEPVVTLISERKGKRTKRIYTGYYLPEGWDQKDQRDPSVPAGFEPFSPLGKTQAWNEDPVGATAVESPRFEAEPNCSEGFVVCTAYLKILHADPGSTEINVEMASARRYFYFRTGHGKSFRHEATFLRQSFEAP